MVNQRPLVNGVQLTTCQMVTIARTNRDRPPTAPARKHANTQIFWLFGTRDVLIRSIVTWIVKLILNYIGQKPAIDGGLGTFV